jgi:hypothetical protein
VSDKALILPAAQADANKKDLASHSDNTVSSEQ